MKKRYDQLDVNNKLIWNFRDIGHTMRRISEGKGSQKRILILLGEEENGMTQKELTRRLGIQPGSASEVIGKLEAAGLLTRTPSREDGRTTNVELTEAGHAAGEEAAAQRARRHEIMFSCLSEREKEELLGLLERVNSSWAEQFPPEEGRRCREGCPRNGRGED